MKIAITSQGKTLESQVDPRFGRCQYFVVYDTETDQFEVIENPASSAGGGAGILTAQMISEKNVQAVLTGNAGPNAFETLTAADIQVVAGVSGSIAEAVKKFKSGGWKALSAPSVTSHHGMNAAKEVTSTHRPRRIAVASEDDKGLDAVVAAHFGRCPFYTLVDIENENLVSNDSVENPFFGNHGQPGQVPAFIRDQKADVIIAGGMGQRAVNFFNDFGIEVVTGAGGTVKSALEEYLKGTLSGTAPCKHESCHE